MNLPTHHEVVEYKSEGLPSIHKLRSIIQVVVESEVPPGLADEKLKELEKQHEAAMHDHLAKQLEAEEKPVTELLKDLP